MSRLGGSGKSKSARRRLAGAGAAVGTFLAVGLTPATPSAHADGMDFDWLIDMFTPVAGVAAETTPLDSAAWLDQLFYDPFHTSIDNWINSDFGSMVNGWINTAAGQILIGNGVDGTAENPNGGAGGLWFGDGGDGFDQSAAGVAGGNGGAAGMFG
ncbi:MAG: PGRS repeat-containing protein, partial [Mycobacterium sp.]